jgi:hypothetical protein
MSRVKLNYLQMNKRADKAEEEDRHPLDKAQIYKLEGAPP